MIDPTRVSYEPGVAVLSVGPGSLFMVDDRAGAVDAEAISALMTTALGGDAGPVAAAMGAAGVDGAFVSTDEAGVAVVVRGGFRVVARVGTIEAELRGTSAQGNESVTRIEGELLDVAVSPIESPSLDRGQGIVLGNAAVRAGRALAVAELPDLEMPDDVVLFDVAPLDEVAAAPLPTASNELAAAAGLLVLSDGSTKPIIDAVVLGREPMFHTAVLEGHAQAVVLDDPELNVSREHLLVSVDQGAVTATDLQSANGTLVRRSGDDGWLPLVAGKPSILRSGDTLRLGTHDVIVELGLGGTNQ